MIIHDSHLKREQLKTNRSKLTSNVPSTNYKSINHVEEEEESYTSILFDKNQYEESSSSSDDD
jgi:hypothetical protein